jgi:hypothetical protein
MATSRSDSPSTPPKSWNDLARRASSELPPNDVDIRVCLRAQLESEARVEPAESSPSPTLWDDLSALSRVGWLRFSLLGGAALSTFLLVAGARALREAQEGASLASLF